MEQLEKYLLGKLICELRTERGWTQSRLCTATKRREHIVSARNTVIKAEQGDESVKEDTYRGLIEALGYQYRGHSSYQHMVEETVYALYEALLTHDFSYWHKIEPQIIGMLKRYRKEPLIYDRMYHLYCIYDANCQHRYADGATWKRMIDWISVLKGRERMLYLYACFEVALYNRQSIYELKQLVEYGKQDGDPLYATIRIRMALLTGDLLSARQQIQVWETYSKQTGNAYQMMCCRLYWLEWLILMQAKGAGRQAERLLKDLFLEEWGWSRTIVKKMLYLLHRYCMRKRQWETAYQLLVAVGSLDRRKPSLWYGLWDINRVLLEMPLFAHEYESPGSNSLLFHVIQYMRAKRSGQHPMHLRYYISKIMMPLLQDTVYREWYEAFIRKEMKGLSLMQRTWKEYSTVLEQLL